MFFKTLPGVKNIRSHEVVYLQKNGDHVTAANTVISGNRYTAQQRYDSKLPSNRPPPPQFLRSAVARDNVIRYRVVMHCRTV